MKLGQIFAELGHWYSWATREYILNEMTQGQVIMYYKHIPAEGRLNIGKTENPDIPDVKEIKTLMGGRKVLNK